MKWVVRWALWQPDGHITTPAEQWAFARQTGLYAAYTEVGYLSAAKKFIRGAARSKGGKPIIAVPSTTKNDTISKIVTHLKEGAGVVTSRGDVHYIVTEHGVAYLHGKSLSRRASALINIAHPNFRDELTFFAKKQKLI